MAMIDYGAIAWKNGKLISTEMFTPMKDMVGWDDLNINDTEHSLVDNYFVYVGDEELTIAFYKNLIRIHKQDVVEDETIFFGSERFYKWKEWSDFFTVGKNHGFVKLSVKPVKFHDYYIFKMKYKGDKYKVAFGYGVDLKYYKKYHIIDYYGTPWFRFKELKSSIIDKIKYRY